MENIIKESEHFIFIQPDKTITFDYQPENVDGWKVTGALMEKIKINNPYFDFVKDADGKLIDVTPTERPTPEPPQPTVEERLAAAESALLGLMGG